MNAYIDISSVILETKRLILRPFKEEDLNDLPGIKETVLAIVNKTGSMTFEDLMKDLFDGKIKLASNGRGIR